MKERFTVAQQIAREVGEYVLEEFKSRKFDVSHKKDGTFVTQVDSEAERRIVKGLMKSFAQDTFVGEELEIVHGSSEYVWMIDPIDGTRGFVRGLGHYAVQIGLLHKMKPVFGVVFASALGKFYSAFTGEGAFCNGKRVHVSEVCDISGVRSISSGRIYLNSDLQELYSPITGVGHTILGGFGCKVGEISEGNFEVMLVSKSQGLGAWDLCAPHVIIEEAGGRISTLNGGKIEYKIGQRFTQGIIVSNGVCHKRVLELINQ